MMWRFVVLPWSCFQKFIIVIYLGVVFKFCNQEKCCCYNADLSHNLFSCIRCSLHIHSILGNVGQYSWTWGHRRPVPKDPNFFQYDLSVEKVLFSSMPRFVWCAIQLLYRNGAQFNPPSLNVSCYTQWLQEVCWACHIIKSSLDDQRK